MKKLNVLNMMRFINFKMHFTIVTCIFFFEFVTLTKTEMDSTKFTLPKRVTGINDSAINKLIPFSKKYHAVNLGLDYLDDKISENLMFALANATFSDNILLNQYSDIIGLQRLRVATANLYSPIFNQDLDPDKNVLITIGATGGVFNAINGNTSPGDEWIMIQPFYDIYQPIVIMSSGVPRFTNLKRHKTADYNLASDWKIDKKEMEGLFNERTKGIIINNPINPLGKVYTYEELEFIADMAKKYNTIVISDESHEWMTFEPHIRIASLPDMFERTITIGSSSKTFGTTGWRVGWVIAPANLLYNTLSSHEFSANTAPTPQQDAIASAFEDISQNYDDPKSYFEPILDDLKIKLDYLVETLKESGMSPIIPQGGFCMLAKWSSVKKGTSKVPVNAGLNFAEWLIEKVGVFGVPLTDYYNKKDKSLGEEYLRFCFHKKKETLEAARKRLKHLKSRYNH